MQKDIPPKSKIKIIIVIGPTASGKSDFAVNLALDKLKKERKECVIISADSRQIYKYLDIGSGKITKSEMQGIKHFGIDITEPKYSYNVSPDSKVNHSTPSKDEVYYKNFTTADWLKYTNQKILEVINENKLPIICGGTGLYIDALLYGLQDNPPPNYTQREILKNKTLLELQELLKNKSLEYFENLNNSEKKNPARLIRKLELDNFDDNNFENKSRDTLYDAEFIILKPELKELEEKIKLRLEKRLENNLLIGEIKNLILEKKVDIEWLLSLGLEYRYVTQHILGETDFESMKKILILKITQYAKRQMKWNKRYENITSSKNII